MAQAARAAPGETIEPSKLFRCVSHGSLRDLKLLIKEKADFHILEQDGSSLLHCAVTNHNTDVLEYLLEAGLSLEARGNKGATPLFSCASRGTIENLWALIAHKANISAKDEEGSTVIHYAAIHSNPADMISCLIGEGANIEEKNTLGLTAFHICAQEGNVNGMKTLLREGANFSERTTGGKTALHCAVFDETSQAVEYLLTLGAATDTRDDKGLTPLHTHAAGGSLKNTKLLVEAGADVKAVDANGLTTLHYAVTNKNTSAIIKYLLGRGVAPDSCDKHGNTPLHTCAQAGNLRNLEVLLEVAPELKRKNKLGQTSLHYAAVNKGSSGILAYLLNKGMSMDARDNYGNAAIHLCSSHGSKINMQVLLQKGCDIEMKNAAGQTPLSCSISNEDAQDMIGYLLSQGAAINSTDRQGNSPLHRCVAQGSLKILEFLVDNGADIRAENAEGKTALDMAVYHDKKEAIEYLSSKEACKSEGSNSSIPAFLHCVQRGSLQNLKKLLAKGVDTRYTDEEGLTALHYAVENKESGILELILKQGISLEVRSKNGATPLLRCAAEGTQENLMALIKKGANVRARDYEKRTAIHYAVKNANAAEIVEFLLKQGLSIEERDDNGMTPLHECAYDGTLQNIKMLIDKGASVKAKANKGLTALHYAAGNKNTSEIIEFLLSQGMRLETRDEMGYTPLHQSISSGNLCNTKILVEKGANVKARSKNSDTALHIAAVNGDTTETLQYLLEKGALIESKDDKGRTPLLDCAAEGSLQKLMFLVERGADIHQQDEQGFSSLHLAATNKQTTDIMQYLLDKGMSLEVKSKLGRTPLLCSAALGNLRNVQFLHEKGADLKSIDKNKVTALHFAATNAEGGPIIEYLVAKGIPVDARDELDSSPLDLAKGFGIAQNERILLENGAKIDESGRVRVDASLICLMLEMMNQQKQ